MSCSPTSDPSGADPDAQSVVRSLTKDESRQVDRSRRREKTQKILDDAESRDFDAAERDAMADERSRIADWKSFITPNSTYPGQGERRAAAHDRAESRADRESSAEDRALLSEVEHPGKTPA